MNSTSHVLRAATELPCLVEDRENRSTEGRWPAGGLQWHTRPHRPLATDSLRLAQLHALPHSLFPKLLPKVLPRCLTGATCPSFLLGLHRKEVPKPSASLGATRSAFAGARFASPAQTAAQAAANPSRRHARQACHVHVTELLAGPRGDLLRKEAHRTLLRVQTVGQKISPQEVPCHTLPRVARRALYQRHQPLLYNKRLQVLTLPILS